MAPARALLLALAASPAAAQLFVGRFRGTSSSSGSSSSSLVSSSSWGLGRDGRVHQSLHEVRTETYGNGESTKSEVVHCADGRCRQTVAVAQPGSLTMASQPVLQEELPAGRGFARMRALLRSLAWPQVRVVRVVEEEPQPPPTMFLAPRPQVKQVGPSFRNARMPVADVLLPMLGLCGASASLASLLIIALLKCNKASAREPPLQPLGEPLAAAATLPPARAKEAGSAPFAAAPAPAAPAAGEAARGYLLQVYKHAIEGIEAEAARGYLARAYARAAA